MKLSLLIFFLFPTFISAQSLIISEGSIMHSNAPRPALMVNVDPPPKELKKAWRDYMDDNYDIHLKGIGLFSNKDILTAEETYLPKVTDAVDFYTSIVDNDSGGSEMKVFVKRSNDIYISKELYPKEYTEVRDILMGFMKEYLPEFQNDLVDQSFEQVEDLKEKIADNEDEIEKLSSEIKDYRKELDSARKLLETRSRRLERVNKSLHK